jgi:aspartate kinase
MQILHGCNALINVYLLIRLKYFNRLEKILLSSGYFILYEYAVISRNYALGLTFLLALLHLKNKWIDARNFIITNDVFREATVQWDKTVSLISQKIPIYLETGWVITQGFIGSTRDNLTVTLGREGSDYTASIFAYSLDATEVVIWKDVPGIMNADPKRITNATLFTELSYEDAIEMTYYGARVLHPKTIKPIQNKKIPMNVRSFLAPDKEGTIIKADYPSNKTVPMIVFKENQSLLSLDTKDYSFIAEENISIIFNEVVKDGIKVNVMSNSAISFLICVDTMEHKINQFIERLSAFFNISIVNDLTLITIKNRTEEIVNQVIGDKEVITSFSNKEFRQYIIKN